MKTGHLTLYSTVIALLVTGNYASAKDKPVELSECPAPVQAMIRQYQASGTLEEIGLDEKKKSGGPAVYEVKFSLAGGRRIEVHLTPAGSVIKVEEKKRRE